MVIRFAFYLTYIFPTLSTRLTLRTFGHCMNFRHLFRQLSESLPQIQSGISCNQTLFCVFSCSNISCKSMQKNAQHRRVDRKIILCQQTIDDAKAIPPDDVVIYELAEETQKVKKKP